MTFVMLPVSTVAAPLSVRYGQKLVGGAGLAISAIGVGYFSTLSAHSGFGSLVVAEVILALGIGLAMTPATNAIVSSLPAAKQGVASAVNDTTREIGTALGIAIMGSMFTSGYRHGIDGHLAGLPKDVADQAREAPGLALQAASHLGTRGDALAVAARDAFASGMRFSMLIGAGLLMAGALFVAWRGPSRDQEALEDVVDLDLELELGHARPRRRRALPRRLTQSRLHQPSAGGCQGCGRAWSKRTPTASPRMAAKAWAPH